MTKLIETLPLLPVAVQTLSWHSLIDEIEALPDSDRDEPATALLAYLPTLEATAPVSAEAKARVRGLVQPQTKPSGLANLAALSAAFAHQPGSNPG